MALELVAQLAGDDEECEQEFLRHGVAFPRLLQQHADEVDTVLDEGRGTGGVLFSLRTRAFDGIARSVLCPSPSCGVNRRLRRDIGC